MDGKFVGVLFDVMLKFKAVVRGLDDAEARAGPCRAGDLREVGVHLQVLDDSECNADRLVPRWHIMIFLQPSDRIREGEKLATHRNQGTKYSPTTRTDALCRHPFAAEYSIHARTHRRAAAMQPAD